MRAVLVLARQETRRYRGLLDKRTLAAAALAGLLLAVAAPMILDRGLQPDRGLFRAEGDPPTPLLDVLLSDPAFDVEEGGGGAFLIGDADLFVQRDRVYYDDSRPKSVAAADRLQDASRAWLENQLADEADEDAAFPVRVALGYEPRQLVGVPPPPTPAPTATAGPTPTTGAPTPGPTPTDGATASATPSPGINLTDPDARRGLTPSDIDPPFPMRGLLLTFAYLVPVNFVTQFYAGSLLEDRTNRRTLALLSTPHGPSSLLAGKSLPYVLLSVGIAMAVTVLIGAGPIGFGASLPIILFALAAGMLFGTLARSPRELTFLTTTVTVLQATFLFLPAIFTQVHPVAYLSPVTVIVRDLEGHAVPLTNFLYATVPLLLGALVLAALAGALWREEFLFTPKRVVSKILDALRPFTRTRLRSLSAGALAVPFALGLQLFVLIFAVTLDLDTAFVTFLIGAAIVEEILKGLPAASRVRRNGGNAWGAGLLVGTGFFLGEKGTLAFTLLGFDLLPRGNDALATFGVGPTLAIVFAPWVLHVATATITAHMARGGGYSARFGWILSALVHIAYNLTLVRALTGGAP